jgi:hypothetical protein
LTGDGLANLPNADAAQAIADAGSVPREIFGSEWIIFKIILDREMELTAQDIELHGRPAADGRRFESWANENRIDISNRIPWAAELAFQTLVRAEEGPMKASQSAAERSGGAEISPTTRLSWNQDRLADYRIGEQERDEKLAAIREAEDSTRAVLEYIESQLKSNTGAPRHVRGAVLTLGVASLFGIAPGLFLMPQDPDDFQYWNKFLVIGSFLVALVVVGVFLWRLVGALSSNDSD